MRRFISVLAIVVLAFSATACKEMKGTFGTLGGAGLGALAGSQFGKGTGQLMAVAIGTLAGAWAGSEIGRASCRERV